MDPKENRGDRTVCDRVGLGTGPTSVSKKKVEKMLPGRRFKTAEFLLLMEKWHILGWHILISFTTQ